MSSLQMAADTPVRPLARTAPQTGHCGGFRAALVASTGWLCLSSEGCGHAGPGCLPSTGEVVAGYSASSAAALTAPHPGLHTSSPERLPLLLEGTVLSPLSFFQMLAASVSPPFPGAQSLCLCRVSTSCLSTGPPETSKPASRVNTSLSVATWIIIGRFKI